MLLNVQRCCKEVLNFIFFWLPEKLPIKLPPSLQKKTFCFLESYAWCDDPSRPKVNHKYRHKVNPNHFVQKGKLVRSTCAWLFIKEQIHDFVYRFLSVLRIFLLLAIVSVFVHVFICKIIILLLLSMICYNFCHECCQQKKSRIVWKSQSNQLTEISSIRSFIR